MRHLATTALITLTGALAAPGCYHASGQPAPPPMTIVRQATPNPLAGVRTYSFAPFSFDRFTYEGQPESTWQTTRSPQQQASWANDKQTSTHYILNLLPRWLLPGEHVAGLTGPAAPGALVLAINVDSWANDGCTATLRVQDNNGQVLDEVGFPPAGIHSRYGFADGFRVCLINATTNALGYVRLRYQANAATPPPSSGSAAR